MIRSFLASLIMVIVLAGCSFKPKVVLYTWVDMFPPEILTSFERDTGIKVQYAQFKTNEAMFSRLKTMRGHGYDLIIADDYIIEKAIAEGLAHKLDRSKLINYRNINPHYQQQFYDPRDEYTIPYGAGIQTIVYDPQKVSIPIRGYFDLWDPQLTQKVGIIDNFRVVNGMALKVLGESYNTNDLEKIAIAGEYMKGLAPNIRLIRDDDLEYDLLSGEIAVAVMYTSQVTVAKMENPALEVVFPVEGLGFGIMAAFIPSKAPHTDEAYAFLDYILDAHRGAACFEYLGYYSTFSASDPCIVPEHRECLTLPEDNMHYDSMEMIQSVSDEAEAMHHRVYTEFKAVIGRPLDW